MLRAVRGTDARPATPGLYLHGPVGRGKTWLMDLFYESLPFAQRRRRHFHRLMHEVHAGLRAARDQTSPLEHVAAAIAADTRVLCIDELFVTDIADAMILGGLFAALVARAVTLVATSNVPPGQLYRDGLQRQRFLPAIALLEQHMEVLELAGAVDHRLRQLTRAGTWLTGADAPGRLAALFEELAGDGEPSLEPLEIASRRIPVVRRAGGTVWFGFAELCAGSRSQEDYIEIAREYHSVILEAVPVLGTADEDAARRLIALVDELYDRNVNLVASAAAEPGGIYRGERLAFEFQRTTSRLIEMQSQEYLAREHRP